MERDCPDSPHGSHCSCYYDGEMCCHCGEFLIVEEETK